MKRFSVINLALLRLGFVKIHARKRKNKNHRHFCSVSVDKTLPREAWQRVLIETKYWRVTNNIITYKSLRGVKYNHSTDLFEQGSIKVNLVSIHEL